MPNLQPNNEPITLTGEAEMVVSAGIPMSATGQLGVTGSQGLGLPVKKNLPVPVGSLLVQGSASVAVGTPYGAFSRFSIYPDGGLGPNDAIAGVSSGAVTTHDGTTPSGMRRFYLSTSIPDKAKYASAGLKFVNIPNNAKQYMTGVQAEIPSLGASGPAPYSHARSISVLVKPTRLNYVRNGNFNHSASTSHWTADQCTIAVGTTVEWQGMPSLTVTVPSSAPAGGHPDHRVTQALTDLLPGRTYTVSFHLTPEFQCAPVWVIVDGTYVMESTDGLPDLDNPRWTTVWATFTATATTHTVGLAIRPQDKAAGVTNVYEFTGALAEEAFGPGVYFDGSGGVDYLWESSAGATVDARSFYYEDRTDRAALLVQLLAENTPLGVIADDPVYAVVPSQSLAAPVTAPQPIIFPRTPPTSPVGITGTNVGNSPLGGWHVGTNLSPVILGPQPH